MPLSKVINLCRFLEEFVQRQPCETMENYTDEITSDYKYKLCNFEPILKLPNYKIYTSYKFTLSFSHLSHNVCMRSFRWKPKMRAILVNY